MPPKPVDPNEIKTLALRVVGGEAPGATLAQKVGPLGLSAKVVGDQIAQGSSMYKGLRVTVTLTIQNRKAQVEVLPSVATLLIKALDEPPRDRKKVKNVKHTGNLAFDQVITIARDVRKRGRTMSRTLKGTVLEVLGTAFSLGATVDGVDAHTFQGKVKADEVSVPAQ